MYSSVYTFTAIYNDRNGALTRLSSSGANITRTGDFGDVGTWTQDPTASTADRLKITFSITKSGTIYHQRYDTITETQHISAGTSWDTTFVNNSSYDMPDLYWFVND